MQGKDQAESASLAKSDFNTALKTYAPLDGGFVSGPYWFYYWSRDVVAYAHEGALSSDILDESLLSTEHAHPWRHLRQYAEAFLPTAVEQFKTYVKGVTVPYNSNDSDTFTATSVLSMKGIDFLAAVEGPVQTSVFDSDQPIIEGINFSERWAYAASNLANKAIYDKLVSLFP